MGKKKGSGEESCLISEIINVIHFGESSKIEKKREGVSCYSHELMSSMKPWSHDTIISKGNRVGVFCVCVFFFFFVTGHMIQTKSL